MFCGNCGAELPDDAGFCGFCGTPCGAPAENFQIVEDNINIEEDDQIVTVDEESPKKLNLPDLSGITESIKSMDKKKQMIAGIAIVCLIILIVVISNVSTNNKIGKLEEDIYALAAINFEDEDKIAELYDIYDSLSTSNKRKVANRDDIVNAYKTVEAKIEQRKNAASAVDKLISEIDTSSSLAEIGTVKTAVIAYNNLDDKSKKYVEYEDKLTKAYNKVSSYNIQINESNFWDLFSVEYEVGDKNQYGSGTSVWQSGYTIDYGYYGGTITPNYSSSTHNDYAYPIYVRVCPRYDGLQVECYFSMDLHQTYNGLGIIDNDVHEWQHQSKDMYYNSNMGIMEDRILIENNDAGKSLWNIFGKAYDWSDMFHQLNEFDASRVAVYNVNGTIRY